MTKQQQYTDADLYRMAFAVVLAADATEYAERKFGRDSQNYAIAWRVERAAKARLADACPDIHKALRVLDRAVQASAAR